MRVGWIKMCSHTMRLILDSTNVGRQAVSQKYQKYSDFGTSIQAHSQNDSGSSSLSTMINVPTPNRHKLLCWHIYRATWVQAYNAPQNLLHKRLHTYISDFQPSFLSIALSWWTFWLCLLIQSLWSGSINTSHTASWPLTSDKEKESCKNNKL